MARRDITTEVHCGISTQYILQGMASIVIVFIEGTICSGQSDGALLPDMVAHSNLRLSRCSWARKELTLLLKERKWETLYLNCLTLNVMSTLVEIIYSMALIG